MNDVVAEVYRKILKLRELGMDPYIKEYRFDVNDTSSNLKNRFKDLKPGEESGYVASIAGRIWHIRKHGKIIFMDLYDHEGKIQLVFRRDQFIDSKTLELLDLIDKGDIIGVKGKVIKTKAGEVSILVSDFRILAISWRPIPFHEFGVKDPEQRYRERYLDILLNRKVRRAIVNLYRIEYEMRKILDSKGFVEVHTPKLQPVYGGALAKPFITKINALDRIAYLSIAPETYLKRLVVAGLFRVYEIAVCFRNEDIDSTHYPEFVQLEIYQAFADWNDMMKLTEELIAESIKKLYGSYKVEIDQDNGDIITIDFSPPWKRISMIDSIKRELNEDIDNLSNEDLHNLARKLGIETPDPRRGKIIEKIFEKVVEPSLRDPTFITMFPRDISPLARPSRENPKYVERFELFINGLEVANGYSELNNPILQYHFFKEEEKLRNVGDIDMEIHPMDKDYIRALEYGLPPTGGVGIGLYRLSMAISGLKTIKDVIPFTYIAPEDFRCIAELDNRIYDLYKRYLK